MSREARSLTIAHKAWHCSDCRRQIEPGETYARWVALPGHDVVPAWWTLRLCAACERTLDVPVTEPWPPAIQRPNGRWYQPRSIRVDSWENDGWADYPNLCGAVVLGTHDVERARPLAEKHIRDQFDDDLCAIKPEVGWWRLGLDLTCYGSDGYMWVRDRERGAAGVWWSADYPTGGDPTP